MEYLKERAESNKERGMNLNYWKNGLMAAFKCQMFVFFQMKLQGTCTCARGKKGNIIEEAETMGGEVMNTGWSIFSLKLDSDCCFYLNSGSHYNMYNINSTSCDIWRTQGVLHDRKPLLLLWTIVITS